MWRNIHLASGKKLPRPALYPDPTNEANRLVDSFAASNSNAQLSQDIRDMQIKFQQGRTETVSDACLEDAPTDIPFTQQEFEATLKPRQNTAAGTDTITYSMFRKARPSAHDELLRVINISYDTGKLPKSWKEASIVPIPKPNDTGNHRPISLLSCLGKMAEKIILTRLQ